MSPRDQLQQQLARARDWYAQLAPRERLIVGVGAIVVAITIVFLGIWEPLARAHRARIEALAQARTVAQKLEQVAGEVQRARASGSGGVNRSLSLLAAVDQSVKGGTLGKPPSRLQPEGEREVKVWLEDVPFANLVRWLAELETRYGVQPQSVDVERESAAGLVNARVTLVRP